MEQINIAEVIDKYYPQARECEHKKTTECLEHEVDDDRLYYIIVIRCATCNFPMGDRDATEEEIEHRFK
jgi:hypothetical protein